LRYLTELAARKQRRTVSSLIEWAIEQALSHVELDDKTHDTVTQASSVLWDPDEADRLAKLGLYYPDLLTYDEQVLWKLIQEYKVLWHEAPEGQGCGEGQVKGKRLSFGDLRYEWEMLKKVAAGEADKYELSDSRLFARVAEDLERRGIICPPEGSSD